MFFFIADESYFNTCQDDNGCPNVLFDVSSLKSKWERKSDTEGEKPRENRENKRQKERGRKGRLKANENERSGKEH